MDKKPDRVFVYNHLKKKNIVKNIRKQKGHPFYVHTLLVILNIIPQAVYYFSS